MEFEFWQIGLITDNDRFEKTRYWNWQTNLLIEINEIVGCANLVTDAPEFKMMLTGGFVELAVYWIEIWPTHKIQNYVFVDCKNTEIAPPT